MTNAWPQYLMAALFIFLILGGLVRHGKVDQKPVNAMQGIWISFMMAAVLGAGGFWHF